MALLKLEGWKLFLLILTPAIVGAMVLLISQHLLNDNPSLLVIGQILTVIFVGVFGYWIYSLGTHLARLPPNQKFSLSLFKSALVFSTIYRVSIEAFSLWYSANYHSRLDLESDLWIIPLQLLATAAALYCFYTNSRLLVSAERQQPSDFKDAWQTFGLILAFPIGIWLIQPRLQKLLARM